MVQKYKMESIRIFVGEMKEIEAKILEIDRVALEARLRALGAVLEFTAPFGAVYFDLPDGQLRRQGQVLRLRREGEKSVMTFKRPIPSEVEVDVKVREEIEVVVEDYEATRKILEGLGYRPTLAMHKMRTQYRVGDAHVVIDRYTEDYAFIPEFIEIEAPSREALVELAVQLGYGPEQLLAWSAAELIAHYQA